MSEARYNRLVRVRYTKPESGEDFATTGQEPEFDYDHYHDVRANLHERAEHDWGVAAGLEVSFDAAEAPSRLRVAPGVAIDRLGRMLALSSSEDDDGRGPTIDYTIIKGARDASGAERYAPGNGKHAYVTIEYDFDKSYGQTSVNRNLGGERVKPLVRLTDPADSKRLEVALVLAVVELDHGNVVRLAPEMAGTPLSRKLVGAPAGDLRLRAPNRAESGGKTSVADAVVMTLRPMAGGDGVEFRGPDGKSLMTLKGGDLEVAGQVKADSITVTKEARAQSLEITKEARAGSLTVDREARAGSLTVDREARAGSLTVDREAKADSLTVSKKAKAESLEIAKEAKVDSLIVAKKATVDNLIADKEVRAKYVTATVSAQTSELATYTVTLIGSEGGVGFRDAATGRKIALWKEEITIGVQDDTAYFRTTSDFAWYKGGVHKDGNNDPGGGVPVMTLRDGHLRLGNNGGTFTMTGSANSKRAVDMLKDPNTPNNTVIMGGIGGDNRDQLFFYWKSNDGRILQGWLNGNSDIRL